MDLVKEKTKISYYVTYQRRKIYINNNLFLYIPHHINHSIYSCRKLKTSPTERQHLKYESSSLNTHNVQQTTTPSRNTPCSYPPKPGQRNTHTRPHLSFQLCKISLQIWKNKNMSDPNPQRYERRVSKWKCNIPYMFQQYKPHTAPPSSSLSIHVHTTCSSYHVKQNIGQH